MTKHLSLLVLFVYAICLGQVTFQPQANYFGTPNPIAVTLSGNGTIYYTTDGSDPTASSPSGVNAVSLTVTQTTLIKAKLNSSSTIYSRTYYIGSLPTYPIYFKPPAAFTTACGYPVSNEPVIAVDYFWPGIQMNAACDGWYKSQSVFVSGTVSFNDCNPIYQFSQHTPAIFTDATVFYDYSAGPVTNPPACLLATTEVQQKVISVKVFPNPVQEILQIDSEIRFLRCEILDASGKLVGRKIIQDHQVSVAALPAGVYFLKMISADSQVHYIQFIKK
ncbi:T9SS type A sorting domain-containing protein [Chryseobacterium sp.]|uniref:T9SS type A sorting domain-containing protein n=1 Tax=Chryseobacterium sp. TaxID=1871047 RepID=UPI0011C9A21A|nr:T9SS type A sorting domain-containing protein [Chryseobacterium sp.]TXF77769.1 T9SS type A sorting domain-containing protein [Chryseobacterium sp.]